MKNRDNLFTVGKQHKKNKNKTKVYIQRQIARKSSAHQTAVDSKLEQFCHIHLHEYNALVTNYTIQTLLKPVQVASRSFISDHKDSYKTVKE